MSLITPGSPEFEEERERIDLLASTFFEKAGSEDELREALHKEGISFMTGFNNASARLLYPAGYTIASALMSLHRERLLFFAEREDVHAETKKILKDPENELREAPFLQNPLNLKQIAAELSFREAGIASEKEIAEQIDSRHMQILIETAKSENVSLAQEPLQIVGNGFLLHCMERYTGDVREAARGVVFQSFKTMILTERITMSTLLRLRK